MWKEKHVNRQRGFARRPILCVDAEGYGSGSSQRQHWIQDTVPRVLSQAAEEVGFDRSTWMTQAGGDSELAVLSAQESEPLLVDDFMTHLNAALREANDGRERDARLRLRAVVHHGTAVRARSGFSGPGPVTASRILDCEPLKRALRLSPASCLVLAVSREVFQTVVASEFTTLRAEAFREVRVRAKEFDDSAWIRVFDGRVRDLDLDDGAPRPGSAASRPGAASAADRPESGDDRIRGRDIPRAGKDAQDGTHNSVNDGIHLGQVMQGRNFSGFVIGGGLPSRDADTATPQTDHAE